MPWESRLTGFIEVPGIGDPVVFRYPARRTGCVFLLLAAVILGFGLGALSSEKGGFRWFFTGWVVLGGGSLLLFGCWQLLVHRRLEVHVQARRLVSINRKPFGGSGQRVYPFDQIRMISVSQHILEGSSEGGGYTVVIELRDGDHIDLGNYSEEGGGRLAARLHELTGASVGK